MTLACALHGWPLEYVDAARDYRGAPRAKGELRLVAVEIGAEPVQRRSGD